MEENLFTNTLAIKFLCFISIIFVYLNLLEIEKIYIIWVQSISLYNDNIFFLDHCIKFPLLSKTFCSLFSLFLSVSTAIFTLFVSIQIQFFLEKLLLTYVYFNFYLFGPYLLFSSFFAIINFDEVFHSCKQQGNSADLLTKAIKATLILEKQNNHNFYTSNFSENIVRGDKILFKSHYASVSNVFNLVTTIIVSFLLCLSMSLYETYVTYNLSILRKDGGNAIIRKAFWLLVSKNRSYRINRRDPVSTNNILRNSNNSILVGNPEITSNLINNNVNEEETLLLVRTENN